MQKSLKYCGFMIWRLGLHCTFCMFFVLVVVVVIVFGVFFWEWVDKPEISLHTKIS